MKTIQARLATPDLPASSTPASSPRGAATPGPETTGWTTKISLNEIDPEVLLKYLRTSATRLVLVDRLPLRPSSEKLVLRLDGNPRKRSASSDSSASAGRRS